jgi:hypothetical protein
MALFHKKSTWEKLIEPISDRAPKSAAKSGLAAVVAFVGISLASAAVSAVRQRKDGV